MSTVGEPGQAGSGEGAQDLGCDVAGNQPGVEPAEGCEGEGHRWIEVPTSTEVSRGEDAQEDRHGPCPADDEPPAILAFALFQQDVGDDSAAEEEQECGADEFCDVGFHGQWGLEGR